MNKNELMKEIIENYLGVKINDKQASDIIESWDEALYQMTFSPDTERIIKPEKDVLLEQQEMVRRVLEPTKFRIDFNNERLLCLEIQGRNEIYTPYWKNRK